MSLSKTALLNVLGRGDGPRRETLREERARDKAKLPEDETQARQLVLASGSPRRLMLLFVVKAQLN